MSRAKRKGRATAVAPPTARDLLRAPLVARTLLYPDLAALRGNRALLLRARALAQKFLAVSAAAGLAAAATGCEPPQCQPTRLDEVKVHGDTALTDVGSFQLKDAVHELGVGLGVSPHPVSIPMAGAMPPMFVPPMEEDAGPPDLPDGGT